MDNYEELVEQLRCCASHRCNCAEEVKDGCWDGMILEAADAIEGLMRDRDVWKETADDWRDAYHHWLQNYLEFVPVWFPVEEQLPSQEGNYLTAHTTGCVRQNYFMILENGSVKWWDNSEYAGFVTHWMKLPEPPKEDEA